MVPEKSLELGIDAIAQLIVLYPELEIEYLIIGDGELKDKLQLQINRLKLKNNVKNPRRDLSADASIAASA